VHYARQDRRFCKQSAWGAIVAGCSHPGSSLIGNELFVSSQKSKVSNQQWPPLDYDSMQNAAWKRRIKNLPVLDARRNGAALLFDKTDSVL
jgi:hypothetical protein